MRALAHNKKSTYNKCLTSINEDEAAEDTNERTTYNPIATTRDANPLIECCQQMRVK